MGKDLLKHHSPSSDDSTGDYIPELPLKNLLKLHLKKVLRFF